MEVSENELNTILKHQGKFLYKPTDGVNKPGYIILFENIYYYSGEEKRYFKGKIYNKYFVDLSKTKIKIINTDTYLSPENIFSFLNNEWDNISHYHYLYVELERLFNLLKSRYN